MIELCKNLDMLIVKSRIGSDKHIGGVTCKTSSTVDYVLATLEVFKFLQDFDIVDFCNLYSDVHNPVSFSFANYKNVLNHACTYNVYKQKQTRRTINMVTRKGRCLL